jgi:hypothetical protein
MEIAWLRRKCHHLARHSFGHWSSAPPKLNAQDPYYGDNNSMVEEIPLSWQVEEIMVVANEDKAEDRPQLGSTSTLCKLPHGGAPPIYL